MTTASDPIQEGLSSSAERCHDEASTPPPGSPPPASETVSYTLSELAQDETRGRCRLPTSVTLSGRPPQPVTFRAHVAQFVVDKLAEANRLPPLPFRGLSAASRFYLLNREPVHADGSPFRRPYLVTSPVHGQLYLETARWVNSYRGLARLLYEAGIPPQECSITFGQHERFPRDRRPRRPRRQPPIREPGTKEHSLRELVDHAHLATGRFPVHMILPGGTSHAVTQWQDVVVALVELLIAQRRLPELPFVGTRSKGARCLLNWTPVHPSGEPFAGNIAVPTPFGHAVHLERRQPPHLIRRLAALLRAADFDPKECRVTLSSTRPRSPRRLARPATRLRDAPARVATPAAKSPRRLGLPVMRVLSLADFTRRNPVSRKCPEMIRLQDRPPQRVTSWADVAQVIVQSLADEGRLPAIPFAGKPRSRRRLLLNWEPMHVDGTIFIRSRAVCLPSGRLVYLDVYREPVFFHRLAALLQAAGISPRECWITFRF